MVTSTGAPAPDPKDALKAQYEALGSNLFNPDAFRAAVMAIGPLDRLSKLEIIAAYDRALIDKDPRAKVKALYQNLERAGSRIDFYISNHVPDSNKAEDEIDDSIRKGRRYLDSEFGVRER